MPRPRGSASPAFGQPSPAAAARNAARKTPPASPEKPPPAPPAAARRPAPGEKRAPSAPPHPPSSPVAPAAAAAPIPSHSARSGTAAKGSPCRRKRHPYPPTPRTATPASACADSRPVSTTPPPSPKPALRRAPPARRRKNRESYAARPSSHLAHIFHFGKHNTKNAMTRRKTAWRETRFIGQSGYSLTPHIKNTARDVQKKETVTCPDKGPTFPFTKKIRKDPAEPKA